MKIAKGKEINITYIILLLVIIAAVSVLLSSCGKTQESPEPSGIRYDGPAYVIQITDKTVGSDIPTASALEEFYKDDKYTYYFPTIKSQHIECTLSDGSTMNIKEALEKGLVKLSDLDFYKINYYMQDASGDIQVGSAINEPKEDEKAYEDTKIRY